MVFYLDTIRITSGAFEKCRCLPFTLTKRVSLGSGLGTVIAGSSQDRAAGDAGGGAGGPQVGAHGGPGTGRFRQVARAVLSLWQPPATCGHWTLKRAWAKVRCADCIKYTLDSEGIV